MTFTHGRALLLGIILAAGLSTAAVGAGPRSGSKGQKEGATPKAVEEALTLISSLIGRRDVQRDLNVTAEQVTAVTSLRPASKAAKAKSASTILETDLKA